MIEVSHIYVYKLAHIYRQNTHHPPQPPNVYISHHTATHLYYSIYIIRKSSHTHPSLILNLLPNQQRSIYSQFLIQLNALTLPQSDKSFSIKFGLDLWIFFSIYTNKHTYTQIHSYICCGMNSPRNWFAFNILV